MLVILSYLSHEIRRKQRTRKNKMYVKTAFMLITKEKFLTKSIYRNQFKGITEKYV